MKWRSPIGLGLALAVVFTVALQAPLWSWNVEDAAISFGYARNIAEGYGPVPYPGAAPVEGYSNFSWVALLIPSFWLGLDPFVTAPLLGMCLTALSVVFVFLGARPSLGERGGLAAAWVFGTFAQTTIWAQSGLENALYSFFLAAGIYRLQVDGSRPWAAACFLGLAVTRPEAPAVSAMAALTAALLAAPYGPGGVFDRVRGWVWWALVPLAVYHFFRYFTFAAEFPATYYAKVHSDGLELWMWDRRSWTYLRRFAMETGFAMWVPAVLWGIAGPRGWRSWVGVSAGLTYAACVVCTYWWSPSGDTMVLASCGLAAVALGLALSRGGILAFVGAVGLLALFFSVVSTGDWMKGWRWMSLLSVPIAYALGGSAEAVWSRANHVRWWLGPVVVGLLAVGWTVQQASLSVQFSKKPETSPWSIKRRVNHYLEMADTLQLRRRFLVIDQDMGANIYWGGLHYDVRDARGLTDLGFALPPARRGAVDSLLTENVYELPAFIHMHAATRRTIAGRRWFNHQYVEVPGYHVGSSGLHNEQFVRRDLVMGGEWNGPKRRKSFDGFDLVGWRTRSPEVSPGAGLYFEVAVAVTRPAGDDLSLWLVAKGPKAATHTWALPLGYGLFGPSQWDVDEVFVGKYPLRVPEDLPMGDYDFALVVSDSTGVRELKSTTGRSPILSTQEAVLGRGMKLVHPERMREEVDKDLELTHEKLKTRSCQSAESRWEDALAHRIRSTDWRAQHEPEIRAALAKCWGDRGGRKVEKIRSGSPDVPVDGKTPTEYLLLAASDVQRGRTWDPLHEDLARGARRVATLLEARGRTLEARGEWDTAFQMYDVAVRTDPSWVFLQRKVERLRAKRLGYEDRLGPLP